jgi:hypothetical protein
MFGNILATAFAEKLKDNPNFIVGEIITDGEVDSLCIEICHYLGVDPHETVLVDYMEYVEMSSYGRQKQTMLVPEIVTLGFRGQSVHVAALPTSSSSTYSTRRYMLYRAKAREQIAIAAACTLFINRREG